MVYWFLRLFVVGPLVRVLFRPWVEGAENIPASGPAVVVSNHISAGDTFILPAMVNRRMTFPAKRELFEGTGLKGRLTALFLRAIGQLPMDRSGGRASATSMDPVLSVLEEGKLLGIYPEGTRSPDGRLYKGKTGVARLVLKAGVPVIPVAMINTQFVQSRIPGIKTVRRPGIRIGRPLDFSQYAGAGNNRDVLRYVTDEIMYAVMKLSGQTYVDAYGSSVKEALEKGREFSVRVLDRPGTGIAPPSMPLPEPAATPKERAAQAGTPSTDPADLPPAVGEGTR
ncbi:MAG TPA: lysophospholipid acyltransferase family protein [Microlunatus sp.]|nr:lysophospholipid acyltransferase family protein [Microlunatus sp.]